MAERSKAPDSREITLHSSLGECGCSGPRMWAWVRIPLLTNIFRGFCFQDALAGDAALVMIKLNERKAEKLTYPI